MSGNPYPKPGPIEDRKLLRGRDGDVAVVRSHLTTRRWTALYGRSGAGKSSLLAAGIRGDLEQKERYKVIILNCGKAPGPLFDALALEHGLSERGFSDVEGKLNIKYAPDGERKLLLILDQFEEYLHVHDKESDKFLEHLVRNDWFVNVCVGIREDELYRMARLRTSKFNPFDNLIELRDLSEDAAREIIVGPVSSERERLGLRDEKVDRIVESLREGRFEGRILAALLAIVCFEMWGMEGKRLPEDVDRDIRYAIRGYCHRSLNDLCKGPSHERTVVRVLGRLSAGRLRRPASTEELRKYVDEPEEHLRIVLKELVGLRLVERTGDGGGVDDSLMIVHDRFVEPIEDWVRERPTPPEEEKPDSKREGDGKRISLLEAQLRLAELRLAVAWGELSRETAIKTIQELWPRIRDTLDVTSKKILRGLAIRFEVTSFPARVRREVGDLELSRRGDSVEIRLRREGVRLSMPFSSMHTQGDAVDCSFSEDRECVVAHDRRGFLSVWDLAGILQIRVAFTPAAFASAILNAEDIYRHLVGEVEPETVTPAASTEDLVYTFQELSGE